MRGQNISTQTHHNYFVYHILTRDGQKESRDAASQSQNLCISRCLANGRGKKRVKTGNTECLR